MYDYNLAPKALSEQCAAFKKQCPTLDDLPADDYIMMAKYDGCLAIITPEGVITRTGEAITSIPQCMYDAAELLPGQRVETNGQTNHPEHKDQQRNNHRKIDPELPGFQYLNQGVKLLFKLSEKSGKHCIAPRSDEHSNRRRDAGYEIPYT